MPFVYSFFHSLLLLMVYFHAQSGGYQIWRRDTRWSNPGIPQDTTLKNEFRTLIFRANSGSLFGGSQQLD